MIFWNVYGIRNLPSADFSDGIDFIGISEIRASEKITSLSAPWENFRCESSEAVREKSTGRAGGSILTLSRNDYVCSVIGKLSLYVFVSLQMSDVKYVIGTVYFKPSNDILVALDLLQLMLDEILNSFHDVPILIAGDFNSRMGELGSLDEEIVENSVLFEKRTSKDEIADARGVELNDFMERNGFVSLNGCTDGDINGEFTFENSNGQSTINLCRINAQHINLVEFFKVMHLVTGSDHFPISVSLNPPPGSISSLHNKEKNGNGKIKRFKFQWEPSKARSYMEIMDSMIGMNGVFTDLENVSIDEQSDR